jgi:hypothetical protein
MLDGGPGAPGGQRAALRGGSWLGCGRCGRSCGGRAVRGCMGWLRSRSFLRWWGWAALGGPGLRGAGGGGAVAAAASLSPAPPSGHGRGGMCSGECRSGPSTAAPAWPVGGATVQGCMGSLSAIVWRSGCGGRSAGVVWSRRGGGGWRPSAWRVVGVAVADCVGACAGGGHRPGCWRPRQEYFAADERRWRGAAGRIHPARRLLQNSYLRLSAFIRGKIFLIAC